jgi:hypothetical protein
MDLFLLGIGIYMMDFVLLGSTKTPSFEITCPSSFPSETTKMLFFGFKDMPYFIHLPKIYFRC